MSKPLGRKNYGSIGHLPNSRMGSGDHHCHEGQMRIATIKKKHKHQRVYVQEKLDGSNIGVALLAGELLPITRSGYLANTSPYLQHHLFYHWAMKNSEKFKMILKNGERICGEWLLKAHGTKYDLTETSPFVAFDIINHENKRMLYEDFKLRIRGVFTTPFTLPEGCYSVENALAEIGPLGRYGALETIEGAVWRVEDHQTGKVDFVVKYVRPEKIDGKYFLKDCDNDEMDLWNKVNWNNIL